MPPDLVLIDQTTGQMAELGWMDDITDFTFGSDILALSYVFTAISPDGTQPHVPATGGPQWSVTGPTFTIPTMQPPIAQVAPGVQVRPPITDPFTGAMAGAYQAWTVPGQYFVFSGGVANAIIIPISRLRQKNNSTFSLVTPIPGYGIDFIITKKQTVYVPWDDSGVHGAFAFPGGDVDEWGNVFPIRPSGLNANANGTLFIAGQSPDPAGAFIPDSGWGAWVTQADSNQQCAALNVFFGGSHVNYNTKPWEFWFTQWCGGSGTCNARTYKSADIRGKKFIDFFGPVTPRGSAGVSFLTGHGARTSSWGFVDGATANHGVGKSIFISGDTASLKLTAGAR